MGRKLFADDDDALNANVHLIITQDVCQLQRSNYSQKTSIASNYIAVAFYAAVCRQLVSTDRTQSRLKCPDVGRIIVFAPSAVIIVTDRTQLTRRREVENADAPLIHWKDNVQECA